MLLEPDTSRQLTQVKLALVLVVTRNGLLAGLLNRRRGRSQHSRALLVVAALCATGSQGGWGAMAIGFLNR